MHRVLTLILFILMTSCLSHQQVPPQTIAFNFIPNEKVVRALIQWENALGQPLFLITKDKADILVIEVNNLGQGKVLGKNRIFLGRAERDYYAGTKSYIKCKIQLLKNDWTPHLLVHEIGHCFGLPHSRLDNPETYSVMSQAPRKGSIITIPHKILVRRNLIRRKQLQDERHQKR